jgi:hypothetical protein
MRAFAAQARSTSSVSAEPQTPVRRILALTTMPTAMSRSAGIDVEMADAFEMGEDRHPRLVLHTRDEAFAAARDDDVEIAAQALQHFADGCAISVGTSWIASSGSPADFSPSTRQAWIASDELSESEPPRRITGLPALRHSAPASAVTFGRLS